MMRDIVSNVATLDFLQMLQNLLLVAILSFDVISDEVTASLNK